MSVRTVICGAGITGLALAGRLASLGGDVVLVERAPRPREQGYMIDFFGPGHDAVEAMGLLPALRGVAYPLEEAALLDRHGRRRAGVRPEQFARGPLLNLMRPDLERVLRESLPPQVEQRFGAGPVEIADTGRGVRVTLDDGTRLDADLLVGADGVHSTVRRLVFGPEPRFLRYLGFHTAAFTFEDPGVHAEVEGRACLTDTVDRQMGFYGLRDGRVTAFAVHRTPDPALPDDRRASLRATYAGMGWRVPTALDRCPPSSEVFYDQVAQIRMPAWSKGRVVLAGDACSAVSLLAGLGASLGIAGAYVLADRLFASDPPEAALAAYERAWRPLVEDKQRTGRAAARWFLPGSPLELRFRRVMLRASRLPVLDRYVAAMLAGKSTALITNLRQEPASPRPTGHGPTERA